MPRRLISTLALVLAATGIPVATAGSAQAIPACKAGYQCTQTYYTTIDHEVAVGGTTRFCDGSTDSWGVHGRYTVVTQAKCSDG